PEVRSRHPYLGQSSPVRILSADERCATCSATLLTVVVGETHTLRRDPVDVGRAVPHQTFAVAAHVRDPDVIAPNHQNVWLSARHRSSSCHLAFGDGAEAIRAPSGPSRLLAVHLQPRAATSGLNDGPARPLRPTHPLGMNRA